MTWANVVWPVCRRCGGRHAPGGCVHEPAPDPVYVCTACGAGVHLDDVAAQLWSVGGRALCLACALKRGIYERLRGCEVTHGQPKPR